MLLLYCVYVEWRWIRTRTQRRSTANEMNVEWWYIIMYVSIDDICRGRMAKIFEIYYGLENEWMNGCVCRYVGCSVMVLVRNFSHEMNNEETNERMNNSSFALDLFLSHDILIFARNKSVFKIFLKSSTRERKRGGANCNVMANFLCFCIINFYFWKCDCFKVMAFECDPFMLTLHKSEFKWIRY